MAQLALGAAFAVGGSFFGIPPNVGFLVGSTLGGLLFAEEEEGTTTRGPRLGDTNVSASTYGLAIGIGYGTDRWAGNMIWTSGLREIEEVHTSTVGGKGFGGGGPTNTQITYRPFADWAMSFNAREASDALRIWFDKDLVFDKTGTDIVRKAGLKFRFYPGDEEQLPDSLMEAQDGVGEVPAYRGQVYIVFENVDLSEYRRIPTVTVELAFASQTANTVRYSDDFTVGEGGIFDSFQTSMMAVDHKRRKVYALDATGGSQGVRVYDLDSLEEVRQKLETDIMTESPDNFRSGGEWSVGDSGFIYANVGGGNSEPIVRIDPSSLEEVARFGSEGTGTNNTSTRFVVAKVLIETAAVSPLPTGDARQYYLVQVGLLSARDVGVLNASDMTFIGTFNDMLGSSGDSLGAVAGTPQIGEATAWFMTHAGGDVSAGVHKLVIDSSIASNVGGETFGLEFFQNFDSIPSSTWNDDSNAGVADLKGPVLDPVDEGLIFIIAADSFTGSYVFKWREDDGIVWVKTTDTQAPVENDTLSHGGLVSEGLFGWVDTTGTATLLDASDGELLIDGLDLTTVDADFDPIGQHFFDGDSQSVVTFISGGPGVLGQAFIGRATGLGETLRTIVEDISQRVGFTVATDLDATELTDNVRGFAVARQMTGRDAIGPLSTAFFFEGIESDDKVKFPKRGKDPDRTLLQADLLALDDKTGDVVREERTEELDLPLRLAVTYKNVDTDYQADTRSSKRTLQPHPTMRSRNETAITLPIVFSETEAEQIAEKMLFTTWNERTIYEWRTAWEHLDLDPADVVVLSLDGGLIQVRIIEATVNLDLSVSMKGLTEDKITFVTTATGEAGLGFPQKIPPGPEFTKLFLLDVPLLRDVDDTARAVTRFYLAMNGYQDGWLGGALWDSDDGATFADTGIRSASGVGFGVCRDLLPITSTPFMTDETTQLRIFMDQGSLVSVTQTQFEDGDNAALIGNPATGNWELVLFKNAVLQGDGSYLIDTLRRGRRGTDFYVNTHSAGETFIFLERATIDSMRLPLSKVSAARFYKGVGLNVIPEAADTLGFTTAGSDLKPYSPVGLEAVEDGGNNIDFEWTRRTRIGGEFLTEPGPGPVPLAEDSEEYELDVKDGPDGAVVRTFTGLSTTAVQYDNADIITDFGSVPSSITFEVFQISAQVGRGFGREATIVL
jgi:hypothetical protein